MQSLLSKNKTSEKPPLTEYVCLETLSTICTTFISMLRASFASNHPDPTSTAYEQLCEINKMRFAAMDQVVTSQTVFKMSDFTESLEHYYKNSP